MDDSPHVATNDPARLTAGPASVWRVAAVIALVFLCLHLPWWPPGADDLDAANYMAGVREFDPARHQPHPPGTPVYIALGKVSAAVLHAAGVTPAGGRLEAWALAWWSMIGGVGLLLAMLASVQAMQRIGGDTEDAGALSLSSAVVMAASPLAWVGAARPMTDVPGLALALAVQAIALRGLAAASPVQRARLLTLAALVAGLAIGIRTQTMLLTAPILALGIVQQVRRGEIRGTPPVIVASVIGCLAWFVPMVVVVGGLERYAAALGFQAGDDLRTATLLWSSHSSAAIVAALEYTFLSPWEALPLAVTVYALALVGVVALLRRAPRTVLLLGVAFGPYVVFHLLFQEAGEVRYGLPIVPPVVTLACAGLAVGSRGVQRAGTVALVAACLWIDLPLTALYARSPLPSELMIESMSAATPGPGLAVVHSGVAQLLRSGRALPQWMQAPGYPRAWGLARKYWEDGHTGEVWIAADLRRRDLLIEQLPSIDPTTRRFTAFRWPLSGARVWHGSRPTDVAWYRIGPPRWLLPAAWSITPGGSMPDVPPRTLDQRALTAQVRRDPAPVRLLLGGRNLGQACDPPARVVAEVDGRRVADWEMAPGTQSQVTTFDWEHGIPAGPGPFAILVVKAEPVAGQSSMPRISLEQFNLQPPGRVVFGFSEGWHEPEQNPETRATWRWTSAEAAIKVIGAERDVVLRLAGESPRRYFDSAPEVAVRAGERTLRREWVGADFDWSITVPVEVLRAAGGILSIETSRTFSPSERTNSPDRRRLGLRILACDVTPR